MFFSSGLGNLFQITDAKTRSICPENFKGEPGKGGMCPVEKGNAKNAARDLGTGWKVNPYICIPAGETFEIANIDSSGIIQHIWLTPTGTWRNTIIRFYWDGADEPSVECPIGDFFCVGWGKYAQINSLPVCVNPGSAFNCYWQMPFKKSCRITLENRSVDTVTMFYQIDYTLCEVDKDAGYFHAQFRRTNPLPYKSVYTIVDGIEGKGQYIGTFMAWGVNNNGWWGEGEIKFFMDGDRDYPTICGTGTEDYFCGSYNFEDSRTHDHYRSFTTPYGGFYDLNNQDGLYKVQKRFGMYRFHIVDPIRFEKDLRVTIQALGWRSGGRYLPLMDDISSVAFWYQDAPAKSFPKLGTVDELEII